MKAKRLPGESLKADARAEGWGLVDPLEHHHLVVYLHHVWQPSRVMPTSLLGILSHSKGTMIGQACTDPVLVPM